MSKDRLEIPDYNSLFSEDRFVQQRENKRQFEAPCSEQETAEALAYSQSAEYMEKNFNRKAVVINPHKACQPLGSIMAALGFEKTLPFIHGSQGAILISAAI